MINKIFCKKLKKEYLDYNNQRKQIIAISNSILHDSKRVIFALHREDFIKAKKNLLEIEKNLGNAEKKFSFRRLCEEGAYKACAEEYTEAKMFYLVLQGEKIDKLKNIKLNFDSYIGGICDLTGELVRFAINKVSAREIQEVKKAKKIINQIMTELAEFDMTGYMRTKYDQAKSSLRKIEQIDYEVNLKFQ